MRIGVVGRVYPPFLELSPTLSPIIPLFGNESKDQLDKINALHLYETAQALKTIHGWVIFWSIIGVVVIAYETITFVFSLISAF